MAETDPLESMKMVIEQYRLSAARSEESMDPDTKKRAIGFQQIAYDLQRAFDELELARERLKPIIVTEDLGSLEDLPMELLSELSAAKVDELEHQIQEILKASGGGAGLDAILVFLYRRYGVVQKRKYLQNKLWRMAQAGGIVSVKGKKGIYQIKSHDDVESIETELELNANFDELEETKVTDEVANAGPPDDIFK